MPDSNNNWIAFALLLAVVAGAGFWYLQQGDRDVPTSPETHSPAVDEDEAEEDPAPKFPLAPAIDAPADLIELPPLADSDAYFKIALTDLFGRTLETMLVESGGVERFVTTVDNLPRRKLAERLRPVQAVAGTLAVSEAAGDTFELSAANFDRYLTYVEMFDNADLDQIVDTYRRFYPLLQEAYEDLGYPDAYFNDRLVEVIDHLLQTPEVSQPLLLKRPHVLYEFADPDLEDLSSGQKLLLRIGPTQAVRVKARLVALRNRLTRGSASS